MSSNAALSAARRRRSNPVATASTTNMQSHIPPANRILQRTGPGGQMGQRPIQPQLNQRIPPQQPQQSQQPQQQKQQQQMRTPYQQSQQQGRPLMGRPQSPLPPLPPPVKNAGPLYGIPVHPLIMFKTHDNKLSDHDLSIGDCLDQLKEMDDRLAVIETVRGEMGGSGEGAAAAAGDLNELMNDGVFINGIVDNIMNTTNFASIIDNIIPLKEENEILKQQVNDLFEKMQQLEDRLSSICVSSKYNNETVENHHPVSIEVDETLCVKKCDDVVVEKKEDKEVRDAAATDAAATDAAATDVTIED